MSGPNPTFDAGNGNVLASIRSEVQHQCRIYMEQSTDHYDFWSQHIVYVVKNAVSLAQLHQADPEIVELAALLHDITLVMRIGTREDHHRNGTVLAGQMLRRHHYPPEKTRKVLECVHSHRSSKNAPTTEARCVADADILAHFDNMDMVLGLVTSKGMTPQAAVDWCRLDYEDLSPPTQDAFRERYERFLREFLRRMQSAP